jgi:hypothetical protein
MDIYRFFHPHHNPRLHRTSLRQLELCELEQAAAELRKALERARERARRRPVAPIMSEHFNDLIKAIRFAEVSLQTLCDAHPGDSPETLQEMVQERSELSGWASWANLLEEQVQGAAAAAENPDSLKKTGS